MTLDSPISHIPLIGPLWVRKLTAFNIKTVKDLLYYIPFRYDDFSTISKIANIQEGETVTIQGTVIEIKNVFTKNGFNLQQAKIEDDTGIIEAVWFNQSFLTRAIHASDQISLSGKIKRMGKKLQISGPKYEIISRASQQRFQEDLLKKASVHTARLVPVYSETVGITSKWLRSRINWVLEEIKSGKLEIADPLSSDIKRFNQLIDLHKAIIDIHFPNSPIDAKIAKRRLAFDELLFAQIESKIRRMENKKQTVGHKFDVVSQLSKLDQFVKSLSFTLTQAQTNVIDEIYRDLEKETPMNRLVQGDVGSGKTVVAAVAMLVAHLNGYESALMAPTEILALQHFETLKKIYAKSNISVGIATGSTKNYENFDILVGTHALLTDVVKFKKLGLVVIDEQHRFGVEQRAILTNKGHNPHVLTMTATPIPRTVALTLYGDLDMSLVNEMPKNRLPIKTWVVPENKRDDAYEWIKKQKAQAFIICPFIEESETLLTVKSAKAEFERLSTEIFPKLKLGLLHGKMKPKEKDTVLDKFKKQELGILVATPVVEVGIDIPTATVMLIEAADRFGLAQLHQLRGRVGRGDQQSFCLLFCDQETGTARLKFLETVNNGLELAEIDLKYRGPGQRLGTAQHGKWDLKIADFSDLSLIDQTRKLAEIVVNNPDSFPTLFNLPKISKINTVLN